MQAPSLKETIGALLTPLAFAAVFAALTASPAAAAPVAGAISAQATGKSAVQSVDWHGRHRHCTWHHHHRRCW